MNASTSPVSVHCHPFFLSVISSNSYVYKALSFQASAGDLSHSQRVWLNVSLPANCSHVHALFVMSTMADPEHFPPCLPDGFSQ